MTNRANIFYDHEIENIVRNRSVGVLSLLDHMFTQYPGAAPRDIFYTVEAHVLQFGMEDMPTVLLTAPQEETVVAIPPTDNDQITEDVVVVTPPVDTNGAFTESEPEIELTPREKAMRARKLRQSQRSTEEEKPRERVNVRQLFDEIDDLQL